MQIKLCISRGYDRLRGDASLQLTGAIGNAILALIIGSVFYNLPSNTGSFYSRGVLLFFAILLNAFASSLEVPLFYALDGSELTRYKDSYSVCATTYRRKAREIRLLSSLF